MNIDDISITRSETISKNPLTSLKQLHSSVRTGNLETSLRLLSLGADPNYFHTVDQISYLIVEDTLFVSDSFCIISTCI